MRIAGRENTELERRLKHDMYDAITRVKPALSEGVSIEQDVMSGSFFEQLNSALQGIAVVKLENAISFYDRVGFRDAWLELPPESALSEYQLEQLSRKVQLKTLHDLAYVSHKHVEKMLGKIESAKLWEHLKQFKLDS